MFVILRLGLILSYYSNLKDICTSNVHLPESIVVVVAWELGAMLAVGVVAVVSVSARVAIVDAIVILVHNIMHAG